MANLNYKEKKHNSVPHAYYSDTKQHVMVPMMLDKEHHVQLHTQRRCSSWSQSSVPLMFCYLSQDFASCHVLKEGAARRHKHHLQLCSMNIANVFI